MTNDLYKAKPAWKILDGWNENIRGALNYNELPYNAKKYLDYIEESVGVAIKYISTEPKRNDFIEL